MTKLTLTASLLLCLTTLCEAQTGREEALCLRADVIFCENYEDRATNGSDLTAPRFKNGGWGLSASFGATVTGAAAFDGKQGLRWTYQPGTGYPGYKDTVFPGGGRSELYSRMMARWSAAPNAYKWSLNSTKHNQYLMSSGGAGNIHFFSANFSSDLWHIQTNNQTFQRSYDQNVAPTHPALGVWHCLESHVKIQSGSADGIIEGWMNGVQVIRYTNVQVWDSVAKMTGYLFTSNWGTFDSSESHPLMWRDNDALIAATARIGCPGSVPPPSVPSGVTNLNLNLRQQ